MIAALRIFTFSSLLCMYVYMYIFLAEVACFVEKVFMYRMDIGRNTMMQIGWYDNFSYYYAHAYIFIIKLVGIDVNIKKKIYSEKRSWTLEGQSVFDNLLMESLLFANGNTVINTNSSISICQTKCKSQPINVQDEKKSQKSGKIRATYGIWPYHKNVPSMFKNLCKFIFNRISIDIVYDNQPDKLANQEDKYSFDYNFGYKYSKSCIVFNFVLLCIFYYLFGMLPFFRNCTFIVTMISIIAKNLP